MEIEVIVLSTTQAYSQESATEFYRRTIIRNYTDIKQMHKACMFDITGNCAVLMTRT